MDNVLRDQLSRDEGRKLTPYKDTNGFWTIGVGHLLGPQTFDMDHRGDRPRMTSITDDECDALLAHDIMTAVRAVLDVFGWSAVSRLDGPRHRALINMAFNRGKRRMETSSTITPAIKAAMNPDVDSTPAERQTLWDKVAYAILESPWGNQIGHRAKRLAEQFRTGVDQ